MLVRRTPPRALPGQAASEESLSGLPPLMKSCVAWWAMMIPGAWQLAGVPRRDDTSKPAHCKKKTGRRNWEPGPIRA
ncbi:hypothetical protein NDU88_004961 [Pleurodeles waltl]|uniref:Uncharacterized protein n=1 Tax=Pleurodeles waltl TaxID=8319 RepID=A0AAV7TSX7_PLEWA|nr:hypothetical protein NDU88_004961 [Pleurodeles waltl]